MRHTLFRTLAITLGVLLLASVVMRAHGQTETPLATQVYTIGSPQTEDSVHYSVVFVSGEDPLTNITITGAIPEGAESVEQVSAPEGATFAADSASVTWKLDQVDAQTLIGPFTYLVKFAPGTAQIPANVAAAVNWEAPQPGSVSAFVLNRPITTFTDSGTISIDAKGTVNAEGQPQPLPVGSSGIWIYVPPGAVYQTVNLTFTRLTIDDASIPQDVQDVWWCAMVRIEASTQIELAQPIVLALLNRQILTIGTPVEAMTRGTSSDLWHPSATAQGMRIAGLGDIAAVMIAGQLPPFLVTGVKLQHRAHGAISTLTASLSNRGGRQNSGGGQNSGGQNSGGGGQNSGGQNSSSSGGQTSGGQTSGGGGQTSGTSSGQTSGTSSGQTSGTSGGQTSGGGGQTSGTSSGQTSGGFQTGGGQTGGLQASGGAQFGGQTPGTTCGGFNLSNCGGLQFGGGIQIGGGQINGGFQLGGVNFGGQIGGINGGFQLGGGFQIGGGQINSGFQLGG